MQDYFSYKDCWLRSRFEFSLRLLVVSLFLVPISYGCYTVSDTNMCHNDGGRWGDDVIPFSIFPSFHFLQLVSSEFLFKTISGQAYTSTQGQNETYYGQDPNENTQCPSTLTRVLTAPLQHRSLCPYYFKIYELPEGWYPRYIQKANCKCQR